MRATRRIAGLVAGRVGAALLGRRSSRTRKPARHWSSRRRRRLRHAEHHQLDFWLGDWQVFDGATNELVAVDHIEKHSEGCIIQQSMTFSPTCIGQVLAPAHGMTSVAST